MKNFQLILFLLLAVAPVFSEAPLAADREVTSSDIGATISGQVLIKDKAPMQTGIVLLYNKDFGPPPSTKYWRVPDMISGTDEKGRFAIQVSKGTYYLQVAQKKPDGEIGPPKESEYFYSHRDAKGRLIPLSITSKSRNLGKLKAHIFTLDMVERAKDVTSIEGVVQDNMGKPVEKAFVFGYVSEAATGRPTFVSEGTDKEGKYVLRVHDGGTFYLKVRSVYGGGTPQEGEYLNVTNEFKPLKVSLKKHQKLKDVALSVIRFTRPASGSDVAPPPPPAKVWKNLGELQSQ